MLSKLPSFGFYPSLYFHLQLPFRPFYLFCDLGAVTDGNARTLDLPLDFLAPGRRYTAQVYRDGEGADWAFNPYALVIEEVEVSADDSLKLWLAPGGGAAIRFEAQP